MRQNVLLLSAVGATQSQIDHALHLRARQRFAPHQPPFRFPLNVSLFEYEVEFRLKPARQLEAI